MLKNKTEKNQKNHKNQQNIYKNHTSKKKVKHPEKVQIKKMFRTIQKSSDFKESHFKESYFIKINHISIFYLSRYT